MANSNQDERLAKRASDTRSDERGSRLSAERAVTEDREVSDSVRLAEKLAILRDVNTKLPSPPAIPGFHLCWLTTTNQSDSLEHRMRLGYELVKPEELPGFCMPTQQSGTVNTDRICVNEMVLAKIDEPTWKAYMKHLHHDLPNEQMEHLRTAVEVMQDGRGKQVGYTGDGFENGVSSGFAAAGRNRAAPTFQGIS